MLIECCEGGYRITRSRYQTAHVSVKEMRMILNKIKIGRRYRNGILYDTYYKFIEALTNSINDGRKEKEETEETCQNKNCYEKHQTKRNMIL